MLEKISHFLWKPALLERRFRVEFPVTVVCLLLILGVFSRFLDYVESRPGAVLQDPLLSLFQPHDVTWITFSLIYLALAIAIVYLSGQPRQLLLAMQCYGILVLFRMAAMYSIPLEPPPTLIPLKDPLVELFAGKGHVLTKDLFFSGHTSTMFLLSLTANKAWLRGVFLVCTLLVGTCVLVQHVHYTVDVVVAPFFCYASYRIALFIQRDIKIL